MSDRFQHADGDRESDLVRRDPSFAHLVSQFISGLPERVTRMENAIRAADFDALQAAAHQLKGSGGGFGYPHLTEGAARLERHARNQSLEQCLNSIEELKAICEHVVVDSTE